MVDDELKEYRAEEKARIRERRILAKAEAGMVKEKKEKKTARIKKLKAMVAVKKTGAAKRAYAQLQKGLTKSKAQFAAEEKLRMQLLRAFTSETKKRRILDTVKDKIKSVFYEKERQVRILKMQPIIQRKKEERQRLFFLR